MNKYYEKYKELKVRAADINNAIAVLSWDQEVNMPPEGFAFRAQQISTLSGILHNYSTSAELEKIIEDICTGWQRFVFQGAKKYPRIAPHHKKG